MDIRRFFFVLCLGVTLALGPAWAQPTAETAKNTAPAKTSEPATPTTPASPANVPAKPNHLLTPHAVSVEEALASLKVDLKITDSQTKNWENFAASAVDSQKSARDAASDRPAGPMTVYDVLQSRQKYMKARADGLEKMAAAFKQLYDSLSSEQKAAADRIISQRLGMVM